ncbi:MAG: M48 family metallopeptidase [Calothrix sp. MO_167.B12]|nr:M48 family metallopeptidase [Calothrix sp. MO_167.B12]
MKPRFKPLLLAISWVILSASTSIIIIFTQSNTPISAQEPAVIIDTIRISNSEETPSIPAEPTAPTPTPTPDSSVSDTKKPEESTPDSPVSNTKKPEASTNEKKPAKATEETPSPEEIARQQKLIAADRLYLGGQFAAAEKLYREVKKPFANTSDIAERQEAMIDPSQLSPAGKVYWRESEAGIANNLETRTLVPLELLVEKYPEFIPGHIRYAEALKKYDRPEDALQIIERAATAYPNQVDLVKARVEALAENKKLMEASIAARQFAILNPKHSQASVLNELADENLKRYKSRTRSRMRGNALANIITGALGYAVTGSLFGPFSALDSTILLLRGESSVGKSVAKQAQKRLDLVEDAEINAYVNEIGQKLANVAGRDDFKYEFSTIANESINAFALPGGKIFINAGAIAKTKSEAELAGLVAHELSHAVLSHGFQLVTQGNLISNVTQYLPLGGTVGRLFSLSYSRDMERQADTLGTRLIVATGYAADGLRNLMVTMNKEQKNAPPQWLSSHPGSGQRVSYLEELITRSDYNRYAYEGVEKHLSIQAKAKKILQEKKEREEKKRKKKRS